MGNVKGFVSIFYKGELIDRKPFNYGKLNGKEAVLQGWRYKYGKKYYDENVDVKTTYNPKIEK